MNVVVDPRQLLPGSATVAGANHTPFFYRSVQVAGVVRGHSQVSDVRFTSLYVESPLIRFWHGCESRAFLPRFSSV